MFATLRWVVSPSSTAFCPTDTASGLSCAIEVHGYADRVRNPRLLLSLGVATALAVGYWVSTQPAERRVAEIGSAAAFECAVPSEVASYVVSPPPTRAAQRPIPGIVPADFVPVEAVVCDPFADGEVSADRWVTFHENHFRGDLVGLVEQVNASSDRETLFPGGSSGPCAESAGTVLTSMLQNLGPNSGPVPVSIEVDGCRRLIADGFVPVGPVPEDVLEELLG